MQAKIPRLRSQFEGRLAAVRDAAFRWETRLWAPLLLRPLEGAKLADVHNLEHTLCHPFSLT